MAFQPTYQLPFNQDIPATPVRGSLEWWLDRLSARLVARRPAIQKYDDYYRGKHPLAFASDKFREAFGSRFPALASNFMALVVDSHRDRLQVQGIRYGEADGRQARDAGDRDAWDWWQRNHLDSESAKLFTESLVKGEGYVLIWPDRDGMPEATIEDPFQMVVETVPGQSWKRRAALKRFLDEDGYVRAELYLPNGLYKFRSAQRSSEFSLSNWADLVQPRWDRYQPRGEDWPITHRLNDVPVVPVPNRPRVAMGDVESEIHMVISNQDAINKLRADALISSEFAAFRQRWAIGLDIPIDEDTGQPIEPFKAAVDRLWVVPPPTEEDIEDFGGAENLPEVKFGEFEQTDVSGILRHIEQEIQAIATISRTPPHYLTNMGNLPSGESLKTVETGLVAKVRDSHLHKGEAMEEVFRLQFAWRGDPRGRITSSELVWRDPESRNDAVLTDSVGKQVSMGLPFQIALEKLGYSPQEILRILQIREEERLREAALAITVQRPALPGQPQAPQIPGSIGVSGAVTS